MSIPKWLEANKEFTIAAAVRRGYSYKRIEQEIANVMYYVQIVIGNYMLMGV